MRQVFFLLCLATLPLCLWAQNNPTEVSTVYENAEKKFNVRNYEAALESIKAASAGARRSDSLLYMRIKILESLYPQSLAYTRDLDTTLQAFSGRVNRYNFPESKYAEVVSIHTTFQGFKSRDKAFYDSVMAVGSLQKGEDMGALATRIGAYQKATPNSFYQKELADRYNQLERQRKKLADYALNKEALKKVGKSGFLTLGYSIGNRGTFQGLKNYNDVLSYFNGNYAGDLGVKYSLNASIFNALINIYAGDRVKAGIIWNIIDAEYTVFDWSNNTLIKEESDAPIRELKSLKAGTRIGPMVAVLINRKIAAAAYYQARPGVQAIYPGKKFSTGAAGGTQNQNYYEIEPRFVNFNLAHEVGLRVYFFGRFFINPFVHFGQFNWQNDLSGNGAQTLKANHKFSFTGIRIGL